MSRSLSIVISVIALIVQYANFIICFLEWDTDLATEAYRQQVEALAHEQVSNS